MQRSFDLASGVRVEETLCVGLRRFLVPSTRKTYPETTRGSARIPSDVPSHYLIVENGIGDLWRDAMMSHSVATTRDDIYRTTFTLKRIAQSAAELTCEPAATISKVRQS